MISFFIAAALSVTPPEQFFCDDLVDETRSQCIRRTRAWACADRGAGRMERAERGSRDPIERLFWQTVHEEQALVCKTPAHVMDTPFSKITLPQFNALEYRRCGATGAAYWDDGGPVCYRQWP